MSDVYHDPVGDHLRAHDQKMRQVRWEGAQNIVLAICIAAAVVGIAWAFAWTAVTTKPRFSTGINPDGTPWCQSFDERQCPIYVPGYTAAPAPGVSR